MRRLVGSKLLRSKSLGRKDINNNNRSCNLGSSGSEASLTSLSTISTEPRAATEDSRTTNSEYTGITDSQLSTNTSQLNTTDYNSITDSNSNSTNSSFVSIGVESDNDEEVSAIPEEVISIPQQRQSRSRQRQRHLDDKEPQPRTATNTRSHSVAVPGDRLRKKILEAIRTTLVPIEENQTVIENDAGFLAQKIEMMGNQEWNRQFPKDTIVIYTDGSCIGDRASGFGIYHGPSHELNRAHKLLGPEHNSGFAEIAAAITALDDLKGWKKFRNEKVIIRSDYLPLIQAMQNQVQNENNRFAYHYGILQELCVEFPNGISFQHVYAHDLEGDPGNDAADEFARQGVEFGAPRSRSKSADVNRNRKRDRSRERGRSASRSNNRAHIRSHSAFVPGNQRS